MDTGRKVPWPLLAGFVLTCVLCAAGFLGADVRLGSLSGRLLSLAPSVSERVSDIPDLLLPFTIAFVVLTWSTHILLRRRGRAELWTSLTMRAGISVPIAFGAKAALKIAFGRVNARVWLTAPHLYGFHWFHGGGDFAGFPSGHMAVFTPIAIALALAFPRWRLLFYAGIALLALALIVTGYHFMSDVAAGAYIGLLADAIAVRVTQGSGVRGRRRTRKS